MFLDDDTELVATYGKYYHLVEYFKPDFKKALIIGGAGYVFPRHYLARYPEATIDVVEIDKQLTELARKYFRLTDNPRLKIYHADGRTFLNRNKEKYDVIFGDAFSNTMSIPYQLTTKEAVSRMYDSLNDDGLVVVNIISAIDGRKGEFLRAEQATYKSVFPQVYLFPVMEMDGENVQNIILVALKSGAEFDFKSDNQEISDLLKNIWLAPIVDDKPVLTDNFAPVDYYVRKIR